MWVSRIHHTSFINLLTFLYPVTLVFVSTCDCLKSKKKLKVREYFNISISGNAKWTWNCIVFTCLLSVLQLLVYVMPHTFSRIEGLLWFVKYLYVMFYKWQMIFGPQKCSAHQKRKFTQRTSAIWSLESSISSICW